MSILLSDGIRLAAPRYVDMRQGQIVGGAQQEPYTSTAQALAAIPATRRVEGLIVYVRNGLIIEQWQFVGGIADVNLVLIFDGTGSGGGVQSVTGINTDNTDPQNPVLYIATDENTLTGDGSLANPLQLQQIFHDATLTGSGREDDPLIAVGGGGGPDTNFATDDLTFTGNRTHDLAGNKLNIDHGGTEFLALDPTVNSEQALFRAFNITAGGNTALTSASTTDTAATVVNAAGFDGSTKVTILQLGANATNSSITAIADDITLTGKLIAPQYDGSGTYVGTAVKLLAVDAGGNVIEQSLIGGTASNGLSIDGGSGDVILGGTLSIDTTIDGGSNKLTLLGTGSPVLQITSTGGTSAVNITSTVAGLVSNASGGAGLYGYSSVTDGVIGVTEIGTGGSAAGKFTVFSSDDTTVLTGISAERFTSGAALLDGSGISVDMRLFKTPVNFNGNRLVSKWEDIATVNSSFELWGLQAGVEELQLGITSTGALKLSKYGVGTFTGTATKLLGVDASGNVTEEALVGGGGAAPFQQPIRTVSSGATFTVSDYTILVDTSSGNLVITVDPTIGTYVGNIKKISSDANTVLISMASGSIDGAISVTLVNQWETVKFHLDGNNAYITY